MQANLTANQSAFAGGLVGGAFVAMIAFAVIWGILLLIAGWKIFEKAGEKGWKILIPIYDLYILYKIVGMKMWFWITLAVSVGVGLIISLLGFDTQNMTMDAATGAGAIAMLLYIAEMIFSLVIAVMFYVRLSKVFGHGIGYAIGLFFFSGIFMLILGFGKSKYNKKLAAEWNK